MRKYLLVFGFLAFTLVFVSGCGKKSMDANGNINNKRFNSSSSTERFNLQNFVTSTMAELKVGDKIVVSGNSNQDGSVNASRIMIGDLPRGNGNFNTSTRSLRQNNYQSDGNQPSTDGENMAPPQGADGQMPNNIGGNQSNFSGGNHSNFQGGNNRSMQGGGMMSGGMIIGEILSKSDDSLVVKMVDGGSKIIFFSNETKILKFDPVSTNSSTPKNDDGKKN